MADQPSLRPDLNGQLLRLEPEGPVFFVIDGQRCLLAGDACNNLFQSTVEPMTLRRMGTVAEGTPIGSEAELVQTPDGAVYLVCQGIRRFVDHQAFIACRFDWGKVIGIPVDLVDVPLGPPLTVWHSATSDDAPERSGR